MGPPIGNKPPALGLSRDPTHVALHYLCLTRLKHEKPAVAWRIVGDAWGLNKHAVQWLIAENSEPAQAILRKLSGDPDRLLRLCEHHAREARPDLSRPATGLPSMPDRGRRGGT